MASIAKRGDSYQITVSNGYDINGKKIRVKTSYKPDPTLTPGKQKKAVEKYAIDFEERVKNGASISGDRITFKDFSDKWMQDVAEKNLEQATITTYKSNLKNKINPHIGHLKLNKIKPHTIIELYNDIIKEGYTRNGKRYDYQYKTLKRVQDVLNGVFKTALLWEVIERNPCDVVKPPHVGIDQQKIKFLTNNQVAILLGALEKEYKAVFREHDRTDDTGKVYHVGEYVESYHLPLQFITFYYVALFGGLRRGENISLTWEDLDFTTNTISVTKATAKCKGGQYLKAPKTKNSIRDITVPAEVIKLLKRLKMEQYSYRMSIGDQWIETTDGNGKTLNFVYTQTNGKQMYIDTPSQRFSKLINDYNKTVKKEEDKLPNVNLHSLRHTMATLLIAEGLEISTVSGRLGHADISTTLDIYTHFLKDHDKKAATTLEKFIIKKA